MALLLLFSTALTQAQSPTNLATKGTSRTNAAPTVKGAPSSVDKVRLTGIFDQPPVRRAYLALEAADRGAHFFSMAEGQKIGQVELLTVDSKAGKVKLRYRGQLLELTFSDQPLDQDVPEVAVRPEADSHRATHLLQAQREREEDARARQKALAETQP